MPMTPRVITSTSEQASATARRRGKAGFLAGIPKRGAVDEKAAARLLALLTELGGADLVGDLKELPDGVFHHPGS